MTLVCPLFEFVICCFIMLNAKSKVRNPFLDLTKAVAIVLVVFGHCIQYGSGATYLNDGLFFDDILFKYIYSFHMPLFMLISGYLFFFSINRETKTILYNKLKGLVVPIFTWAIIHLIKYVIERWQCCDFTLTLVIKDYVIYCVKSFWFLWAVFWCSLVVLIVNRVFRDRILIYLMVFGITFVLPDGYNLHLYKFVLPFFVLGYLYGKYNLKEQAREIYGKKWFLCLSCVAFFVLLCFFDRDTYIYISKHSVIGKDAISQIRINLYRYLIGIAGSIFTLTFLYTIYSRLRIKKDMGGMNVVLSIGKNTMGIYIISSFINSAILQQFTQGLDGPRYLITALESILVISISSLIIILIRKSHWANRCLLGAK